MIKLLLRELLRFHVTGHMPACLGYWETYTCTLIVKYRILQVNKLGDNNVQHI